MTLDLLTLKETVVAAVAFCSLLTTGSVLIGTWFLIRYRIGVLEKIVIGNGKSGLIDHFEELKIECARNHGRHYVPVRGD
jgi:hypothetical protein